MQSGPLNFGENSPLGTSLIARDKDKEMPEFDITAMVDLVFMMNIYFLVTFVTVALTEMKLPYATHVNPLDADTAVVVSLLGTLEGDSVTAYLGDAQKGEAITNRADQPERVHEWVEQAAANGKTAVLLKAEKKVRLGELFRIASAAAVDGVKLHVAVLEKDDK